MAIDLASGTRARGRSGVGSLGRALKESADGKTLFTATDDDGDHALFAIDVASGKATQLVARRAASTAFDVGGKGMVVARAAT